MAASNGFWDDAEKAEASDTRGGRERRGDPKYRNVRNAQIAIEGIAGKWCGDKDFIYDVDERRWNVARSVAGLIYSEDAGRRPYRLDWDEEHSMILWGSSYFFDPSDLADDMFSISWYRNGDADKSKKMFTWRRPQGFDVDNHLHWKKPDKVPQTQQRKKDKVPQTPEEIQAARRKEEIAKKKMEEERQKYEEELKAKRKASEEARKKAAEQAKKEAERRAEIAEEAKRKEEQEMLMRVEEQRKKQEDLAKKRIQEEQRMRQEMQMAKQQKIAALTAAAARAASAVRKKRGGTGDDRKKSAETDHSAAQVATPRVATEDSPGGTTEIGRRAEEDLNSRRKSEICEPDPRPSLTVALLGDVPSRRRLFANLLFVTGAWDRHRLERFQQEQRSMATVASDAHASETSSTGTAAGDYQVRCEHCATSARRFVLMDSPGPEEHMPTAMACCGQAHAALLLVSATADLQAAVEPCRGPLWQRAAVLQAVGIARIIVVVEGMEDPRVNWRRERFEEVQKAIALMLQSLGGTAAACVPVSNMMRSFLQDRSSDGAWFKGSTVLEHLGAVPIPPRNAAGAVSFLPLESCIDRGSLQVLGSVICGTLRPGTRCTVVPSQQECAVEAVMSRHTELTHAAAGELVSLKVSGLKMGKIGQNEALCTSCVSKPIRCVTKFRAALHILKPAAACGNLSAGFAATLCAHGAEEECTLLKLTEALDLETREQLTSPPEAIPNACVIGTLQLQQPVALEVFSSCAALGRFVLRAEGAGTIIALGKVIELPKDCAERFQ